MAPPPDDDQEAEDGGQDHGGQQQLQLGAAADSLHVGTRWHYRVSSKTVPTLLFALLSASTHANCKSWVIYEKFRKFATR